METRTFKAVVLDTPGKPRLTEMTLPLLSSTQVLVKMGYAQINPSDLESIENGFYSEKPVEQAVLGEEGSGIIERIGASVPSVFLGLKVVCGLDIGQVYGTWSQYYIGEYKKIIIVNKKISLEDSCGLITNPVSVLGMLDMLQKRGLKSAAIYPATSQIGRQFASFAEKKGFEVLKIVRNAKKLKEAEEELRMSNVISFEDPEFPLKFNEMCQKLNVRLAFEGVSGSVPMKLLSAMPKGSTVCCMGSLESAEIKDVMLKTLLMENKTICAFHRRFYMEKLRECELNRIHQQVVQKNYEDCFKSESKTVYGLNDFEKAIQEASKLRANHKVVLKLN